MGKEATNMNLQRRSFLTGLIAGGMAVTGKAFATDPVLTEPVHRVANASLAPSTSASSSRPLIPRYKLRATP